GDASKQERIVEIDADEDLSLINETAQDQGMMNDEDLFGVNDLDGDEVIVDVTAGENVEQDATVAEKEVSIAANEVVTIAESVKDITTTTTPQISKDDYFAAKRAEEIENKPPTKAQQKSLLCTYMKNIEGYKQKDFKGKSFDAIKKKFDKIYKRVNTFVAMDLERMEGSKKTQAEVTEGSSKRAGDEVEQESAKRQRLEKDDDTAELKRCLEIVPEDDVTIKATPLYSNHLPS
nr:hypothetical protein [Tanacetum cinerariifolium]GEX37351.1 hypothetical protein [Tanacetum cinerariifolium]GEX37355.1 hypothetical protein [Tanacetum cinerariifolium]GEX37364.1 hypothetical protein [Tanacetum cinerariifolium]GEX37369.1 hypothetical protein [Tanacetum cinerariifolium]